MGRLARGLEQHPGEKTPRGRRVLESASAAFLVDLLRCGAQGIRRPGRNQGHQPGERGEGGCRIHLMLENGDLGIEEERFPRLGTAVRENTGPRRPGKKTSRHQNRCTFGDPSGSPFRENTSASTLSG